jgi:RNA polymerase sigma factor (sigma-70 family)
MEAMATASTARVESDVTARVERALDGDEASFAWIVETFSADMARVCLVVCGDLGLADDAVAAAWPIAWRKLDGLRDPQRLRPWLISIAANQARQMVRARRRRAVREIAVSISDEPVSIHDQNADIDLANALAGLDPDDRTLLALRYVAGFDSNELARVTGLSPSGTRARLARLLDRMRRELSDD